MNQPAAWKPREEEHTAVRVVITPETLPIREEGHLIRVRELLRDMSQKARLGLVDETKIVTAGSELARNILKYASPPGGSLRVDIVEKDDGRKGLRAVFEDKGEGIVDIALAMRDGYSTGRSLGLGLPGSRRLVSDFHIESTPGLGTRVVVIQWAR